MNWKNVKIYLIIVLLLLDIFLAVNILILGNGKSRLEKDSIENTVGILGEGGILIDPSLIPDELESLKIIESSFSGIGYETVAEKISDSVKESVNVLPDGTIRIYTADGSSFSFGSGFGFSYSAPNDSARAIISPIATCDLTSANADNAEVFDAPSNVADAEVSAESLSKEETELAASFLNKLTFAGVSSFSYRYDYRSTENDKTYICCVQTADGIDITDNRLILTLADGKIVSADGAWFFADNSSAYSSELYDQLSILLKELQTKLALGSDNAESVYNITSLERVYCPYFNSDRSAVYFLPGFKITTDEPAVRIYDAVNCELFE